MTRCTIDYIFLSASPSVRLRCYDTDTHNITYNVLRLVSEDSDEDVSMDRQMYRKTNIMKENMFQHGIDNPTLEKEVSQVKNNGETKA